MEEINLNFKWSCPFCAEKIPADIDICPVCEESLLRDLPMDIQQPLIARAQQQLEEYIDNGLPEKEDAVHVGSRLRWGSIILMIFLFLSSAVTVFGIIGPRAYEWVVVPGVFFLFVFLVSFLYVGYLDIKTYRITAAGSPVAAFKAYFAAVKNKRYSRAWAAVSPEGRRRNMVEPPILDVLPSEIDDTFILSYEDFAIYWRSTAKGPKNYPRKMFLKNVREIERWDNAALVLAECKFTEQDSFMGRKEKINIYKLLISHKDRWYIAEPGFQGRLDFSRRPLAVNRG